MCGDLVSVPGHDDAVDAWCECDYLHFLCNFPIAVLLSRHRSPPTQMRYPVTILLSGVAAFLRARDGELGAVSD
jgi:hypothetical protein